MWKTEILFFLLVVIMIRSRKTGSTGVVAYLTNGFIYAKGANIILFFLADPRLGLVFIIMVLLQVREIKAKNLVTHYLGDATVRTHIQRARKHHLLPC